MNNVQRIVKEATRKNNRQLRLASGGGWLLGTFQAHNRNGAIKAWLKQEGFSCYREAVIDGREPWNFRIACATEELFDPWNPY